MRIAYFSETFLPKIDGVVNTICHLLEHLDRRGHSGILFAPRGGPTLYANAKIIGLRGYPFPGYPELRLVPPLVNVNQQLAEFKPDLIHLVNPVSLGLIGLLCGHRKGIPVVASYHTDIPGFAARWGLGVFKPLIWTFLRLVHNAADLNLAPSRFTAEQIKAKGFRNVLIWSRGVDTSLFSPHKRSELWRQRLTAGHSSAQLQLYVGRLAIEKRVEMLYEVVKRLLEVRLAIIGDGPLRSDLQALFSATNTLFTGYLVGEELAHAYASGDVFVFTGSNETFGNVVFEAMASGLTLVAPNAGGVTEIVEDGKTGWLFEAEDHNSLIACINRCVQQPVLTRQMGAIGRLVAESRGWSAVLDGILDAYQALLKGVKPGIKFVLPLEAQPFSD